MEIGQEDMPKIILTISVILIIFAIGVFMFMSVVTPVQIQKTHTQTFAVTDPTVDQDCILYYAPASGTVVVEQYNGVSWNTVSSTYVSTHGNTVTVEHEGLDG